LSAGYLRLYISLSYFSIIYGSADWGKFYQPNFNVINNLDVLVPKADIQVYELIQNYMLFKYSMKVVNNSCPSSYPRWSPHPEITKLSKKQCSKE
jgi:hypothetical protein